MPTRVDTQRSFRLELPDALGLYSLAGLGLALAVLASASSDELDIRALWTLGGLACWRYGWWLTHFLRAGIYQRRVFPKIRERATRLWNDGWRPRAVNVMLTTYKERRDITEKVISSLLTEGRTSGVRLRLFVGTADDWDERVITETLAALGADVDVSCTFVSDRIDRASGSRSVSSFAR